MKIIAGYLNGPWQVELREIDLPDDPPEGYAIVKVDACGICGSDLSAAVTRKKWGAFGHEIAGRIERIDARIKHLREGDRVVLESSSFCGHCDLCRDGRVDLCNRAPGFWDQPAMGFSQYMLAPVQAIVKYDGLSPHVACLTEPLGVAVDMIKTARIQLGDRVCVIGPGPIAIMAIALARASGATTLTCIGRSHSTARLDAARAAGTEIVTCDDDSFGSLQTLHKQFDHVLLTSPVTTVPAALKFLAYGGELTYIGIGTGASEITFDGNDFHFRKLQLRSSFASPAVYYPTALRSLKAGLVPAEQIVSHRMPLTDLARAMQTCRDDKASVVKVVIEP
jgi:L-iditol 2-dehydrogenase